MLKRAFDFLFSIFLILILSWLMVLIALLVKVTSRGGAIFWSERVGKGGALFWMPKYRTMIIDTPLVPTHLLGNPSSVLTKCGLFLRKSSLDELPQLFSILLGHMSFVGPRPALPSQIDLIELRLVAGIDKLKPGLTGWAQVNGRDELSIPDKVEFEVEYLDKVSFLFDLKILFLTVFRTINGRGISH